MNNLAIQRAVSCGFNAGHSHLARRHECGPNVLKSGSTHKYPLHCPPPKIITIDRVVQIAGVENALFLVGDVEGYRMNRNFNVEIPGDAINVVSGNMPSYLLLKDGNMHTLGFSTANIEAVVRLNHHMFARDGIARSMLDLAPQDFAVEGFDGHDCKPKRRFEFRVISNTTMNDCATVIEILVFECSEHGVEVLVDREIWYIIPCRCENGNTVKGANWAAWDNSARTCGEAVFIPGRSTENGTFVLANFPIDHCGHPHHIRRRHVSVCSCGRI